MITDATLARREQKFKRLTQQVDNLFATAAEVFNPEHFPSTSFVKKGDMLWALNTLGQTAMLRFTFVSTGGLALLALDTCLFYGTTSEQVIQRWFIDELGDVRQEPKNTATAVSVSDYELLRTIVFRVQERLSALFETPIN